MSSNSTSFHASNLPFTRTLWTGSRSKEISGATFRGDLSWPVTVLKVVVVAALILVALLFDLAHYAIFGRKAEKKEPPAAEPQEPPAARPIALSNNGMDEAPPPSTWSDDAIDHELRNNPKTLTYAASCSNSLCAALTNLTITEEKCFERMFYLMRQDPMYSLQFYASVFSKTNSRVNHRLSNLKSALRSNSDLAQLVENSFPPDLCRQILTHASHAQDTGVLILVLPEYHALLALYKKAGENPPLPPPLRGTYDRPNKQQHSNWRLQNIVPTMPPAAASLHSQTSEPGLCSQAADVQTHVLGEHVSSMDSMD